MRHDDKLLRLAVVGAGMMARRRLTAFAETGRARVLAVMAGSECGARTLADEWGAAAVDSLSQLAALRPDALLVEVPHRVQDEIAAWALRQRIPALIGGPLASSLEAGVELAALAAGGGVLEAGYEARYKPVWEEAGRLIASGRIGRPIAFRAVALWPGDPDSWYYRQADSGGMPLTHMTYAFLNPLRALFGAPLRVSAFANSVKHAGDGLVEQETCVANLAYPGQVLGSLMAGYVLPCESRQWSVTVLGSEGVLEIDPTEMDGGALCLSRGAERQCLAFDRAPDAFVRQAHAFIDAARGERGRCRNPPDDALLDLRCAQAIVESATSGRTVAL
ncbi:Gfo/Idh/MocA family protein [Chromobacterium sp. CV08]|uniref:Gfo/Idh/MocA family protein n=1 Tax=Chromobacterium sp. CV08 TaxID=3133274 RepID=UPI003DA948D3